MLVKRMPSFAVALSPDGRLLYVGTQEPALRVIDVATGRTLKSVPLPPTLALAAMPADVDKGETIWSAFSDDLEVSPDGKTLAVAEGNDVVLYDSATLAERQRLTGHTDLVRSIQFSHDGTRLASGSQDHTAMVWDLVTGGAIDTLTGHGDAVLGVAFSPDDGTLYTGGPDRHVLVWDLTGRRRFVSRTFDGAPRSTLAGTAVPSPDGQAVVYAGAVASGDNLRFLDIATGRLQAPVVDRDGSPLAAWLPPDDRRVVTAADRVLRLWDRKDNQLVKVGMGSPSRVTALAATPDGGFVVVGDRAGGVRRMATSDLAAAGPRVVLDHPVTAVAPGPGDTAVALLDDKTYAVVNLADGSVLQRGSLGIKPSAAAVSPDGGRLLVGGSSGEVGLFDLGAQEWIAAPVVGHRQIVDSVVVCRRRRDCRHLLVRRWRADLGRRHRSTRRRCRHRAGSVAGGGHGAARRAPGARRHPGRCGLPAGHPVRPVDRVRLRAGGPQSHPGGMAGHLRRPALSRDVPDGVSGRGWPPDRRPQRTSRVSAR